MVMRRVKALRQGRDRQLAATVANASRAISVQPCKPDCIVGASQWHADTMMLTSACIDAADYNADMQSFDIPSIKSGTRHALEGSL